jgi:putative tricarboxylic transport membrane protein
MDFLHAISLALGEMASPGVLAAVLGGTIIGLISGALPGVSLSGLVVLLSVASTMPVPVAIGLAMGMAAPVHSSDSLPAIMLGVPGTVAAQATIMDGYPLARKGKAGLALSAAYFSALIGALIGIVILVAIMPVARIVVNVFAAPEFLVMGLMGVAVVAIVSSGAMLRGLVGGAVGLGIAAIGIDPNLGYPRFVPGALPYLYNGLDLVTVIVGIFALPEVMGLFIENRSMRAGARGCKQCCAASCWCFAPSPSAWWAESCPAWVSRCSTGWCMPSRRAPRRARAAPSAPVMCAG